VGTGHINSGAGHSQSSRFHFAKQQPGKHVPTATKLTAFQHNCGYRAFTVTSCAKVWRDNHDLILHSSLYCMWYRTYTSELYWQLSSVDLTRSVYIKHLMLPFVSRVLIKSLPWIRVCWCWNAVSFVAVGTCVPGRCLAKWNLLLCEWPAPELMWAGPTR
jgi:hypothetical protein